MLKNHVELFEDLYRAHGLALNLDEQRQALQLQVDRTNWLTKLIERIDKLEINTSVK